MAVKYSFQDHLINRQAEAEAAMLKQFEEGHYTLSEPAGSLQCIPGKPPLRSCLL